MKQVFISESGRMTSLFGQEFNLHYIFHMSTTTVQRHAYWQPGGITRPRVSICVIVLTMQHNICLIQLEKKPISLTTWLLNPNIKYTDVVYFHRVKCVFWMLNIGFCWLPWHIKLLKVIFNLSGISMWYFLNIDCSPNLTLCLKRMGLGVKLGAAEKKMSWCWFQNILT